MVQRRQWFEPLPEAYLVLWWVPAGSIPSVGDVAERLDLLRRLGPTPEAFTFRHPFPAPDQAPPPSTVDEERGTG
jgi:hypothetical protein